MFIPLWIIISIVILVSLISACSDYAAIRDEQFRIEKEIEKAQESFPGFEETHDLL